MQFYWLLARSRRSPYLLWGTPVNAFNQQRQLHRCQLNGATGISQPWPDKATLIQLLDEQAQAIAIPEQHLHGRRFLAPESKEVTRERILFQAFLN